MMTPRQIADARAYCEAVGQDPDEMVVGFFQRERVVHPAWQGMIGASPALAVGATELSPRQRDLLGKRARGKRGISSEGGFSERKD